jgi:hypothetical protein
LRSFHQPYHRDIRRGGAEYPVDVRQCVLPGVRIEQVGPGNVAQAVAQGDEPAERPDVRRRERHHRIVGPQGG